MPKLFTAVPAEPPPSPRGTARRLLPLADLFMLVLLSRPAAGSLAATWVTKATLLLAAGGIIGAVVLAAGLAAGLGRWPAALVALALAGCTAFGAGAASVLAVGLAQRRPER